MTQLFDRRAFLLASTLAVTLAPGAVALAAIDPKWKKLTDAQWKQRLPEASYQVLRHEDTERPFTSPLDKEKRRGTFVCAGCDLPLFNSAWKFDSGTGWPSFYTSIKGAVAKKTDFKIGIPRTEYHCAQRLG